jgi:hypothetical protein
MEAVRAEKRAKGEVENEGPGALVRSLSGLSVTPWHTC